MAVIYLLAKANDMVVKVNDILVNANDVLVNAIEARVEAIDRPGKANDGLMDEIVGAVFETAVLVARVVMRGGAIAGWGRLDGELDDKRGERVKTIGGLGRDSAVRVNRIVALENVTRETVNAVGVLVFKG